MNRPYYTQGYRVHWKYEGWSYAVPVVSVLETRFWRRLFGLTWRSVWKGIAISSITAEKKHPDELKQWYQMAIDEYESHQAAWRKGFI